MSMNAHLLFLGSDKIMTSLFKRDCPFLFGYLIKIDCRLKNEANGCLLHRIAKKLFWVSWDPGAGAPIIS